MNLGHGRAILILHNIWSLYNIGALFRTAEGVGFSQIFLTGYSPSPENQKVAKVALGAEKMILWKKYSSITRLLSRLQKEGYQRIALEQTPKSIPYYALRSPKRFAVLLGNEVRGLSPAIIKKTDAVIEIPMFGKKESLNVAVAFGVVAYHMMCVKNFHL